MFALPVSFIPDEPPPLTVTLCERPRPCAAASRAAADAPCVTPCVTVCDTQFENYTKEQLESMCRKRGLRVKGTKRQLAERLVASAA